MSKINFILNTILVLIITSTVSYSFIFSDKILENVSHLNTQSKKYLGYSIPYLEKKKKIEKTNPETLKNFSSKGTLSKNSIQKEKQNQKKTTKKRKSYKKKKKKRKLSKRELSLERRVRILEREIKKLKKQKKQ